MFHGDERSYETDQRTLRQIMAAHPRTLYQVSIAGVIERDSQVQAQAVYTYIERIAREFPEVELKIEPVELTESRLVESSKQ